MAEAAISSLVKLLGDVLIGKVKSLRGVDVKVALLKRELERMQVFLIDANKKRYKEERVRQWISEITELAQDAEDTIEMFVMNVENKRNEWLLKKCTSFPKCVSHLGDEIDSILENLEAIKRSRGTYGIIDLGGAAVFDTAPVERRRRKIEHHPVGLEDDERMLLQNSILDEEKMGLSIAVVEGMGGIGKSTLARKIYNHPDVAGGRFERRAWVVVSSEFRPQETIKQLILELGGSREEIKKLEESTKDNLYIQEKLQQMLHQQLMDKTYFVVLDDVWEEQHWEDLRNAFPTYQQGQGSRLLITTRNCYVAKFGQYVHKMKVLNSEKSWELLLNKALVNGKCPENLESVGREISEKCNGLPLAISVAGGLLMGTQSKSAWEQVLNQINSLLEIDVFSILELSYQNLSPQLKSYFLCLAFFKEDAIISARRLVHMWVGQGLIQYQDGKMRAEEIARGYLDELINRNMVQIKDLTLGCRVKNCYVHDLVREVCLRKAKEEMGFEILKAEEKITSTSSSGKPRHCVVQGDNLGCYSLQQNKHLRSLFLVNAYNVSTDKFHYLKSFQLLKILDIGKCGLKRLPRSFRTLIGLKHLRIDSTETLHLPRWLEDLKKLEVIDVGFVVLPKEKLKMESLRYLRAFNVLGVTNIEDWKNIETLRYIAVGQWLKCSSKLIGSYPIRELGIELSIATEDHELRRVQASLEKMENLAKLYLIWPFTFNPVDVTLLIPQVGTHLTKLKLLGLMTKFPSANVFPPRLTHLTLVNSDLEEVAMMEMGKLPNLVFLKLSFHAYKGERMKVLHDSFPCLEALSLYGIRRLRGIDIEEGGMPHLTHLRIQKCRDLTTENLPKQITISS